MRLLLLSFALVSASLVSAQQTYVPDNNFEAYLEGNGMGNGIPNDDYVTTASISGVGSLIIGGYSIADLTGIEDFVSLSTLYCFDNNLTALDVTNCPNLSDLRCYNNDILSLDLTQCPWLSTLLCFNNSLTTLDLTQNANLSDLSCYDNFLSALDVTQNTNLSLLICYDNQLTSLDVSQNASLVNLRCNENELTTLDVSQNSLLTALYCQDNLLTTLDVSASVALTDLRCFNNQLVNFDVSQSLGLILLMCYDNNLTSLDVSQNPILDDLLCYNNELECLKANNGQNINIDCSNNMLSCISVVYAPWAYANATYDAGVSFDVACQYPVDNDVNQDPTTLTAVQNGATYQWLDCEDNYAVIDETNQSYSPLITGYFAVEITYTDPCGDIHIDTSSCHFHLVEEDDTSLEELLIGNVELVKIVDLMGRETPFKPNMTLIYIYSDGTMERVYKLEE